MSAHESFDVRLFIIDRPIADLEMTKLTNSICSDEKDYLLIRLIKVHYVRFSCSVAFMCQGMVNYTLCRSGLELIIAGQMLFHRRVKFISSVAES